MHDNVVMIVTTLAQYLLIPVLIGAALGYELARSNNLARLKTTLRGGSVGLASGALIVGTVTTFVGLF